MSETGLLKIAKVISTDFVENSEKGTDWPGDLQALTRLLYQAYYLGHSTNHRTEIMSRTKITDLGDQEIIETYRNAVPDKYYEDKGWILVKETDGGMMVEKKGVKLQLQVKDVAHQLEQNVTVRMPTERPNASAGYYASCSRYGPPEPTEKIDRLYININQASAPKALAVLLKSAGDLGLSITVKCANTPQMFERRDTIVAYMPRMEFREHKTAFLKGLLGAELNMEGPPPAFTKELSRGIGWAEDPTSDGLGTLSFGMHRCRVIARAIKGVEPDSCSKQVLTAILEGWADSGLDIDKPHISPRGQSAD